MKQVFTVCLTLIFIQSVNGQNLQTERKTVVFKHTADWCDVCGEWGWLIKDSLLWHENNNPDYKAYLISCHDVSDQDFLNAEVCTSRVYNAVPGIINAYPSFVVDNFDINTFEDLDFWANTDDSLVAPAVDSLLYYVAEETSEPASVAIGFEAVIKNVDSLVVKTKVKLL